MVDEQTLIQLQGIGKEYRVKQRAVAALSDVDLNVNKGELVAIRGASGSGKTTMLMMIGGMLRPSCGSVRIAEQDVYSMSSGDLSAFRNKSIGFVFQTFHLVPYLNVLENVALASRNGGANAEESKEILERLGLSDRLDHRPSQLSAGEQQRTAIARAMLNRPSVILADEPGGNLDEENATQVFEILKAYCETGGTVMVVTHGRLADQFADRTVRLSEGRIVAPVVDG